MIYLSESPDDDISLQAVGGNPTSGWPVRQSRTQETEKSPDPHIIEIIITELSTFLCIPTESVREESSLLSLGLDSLKSVSLSHRLKERGIHISPMNLIRAGSIRGVASASAAERRQESSNQEESVSELEQLLRQDLPVESVRLDRDDQIEITAATALQAGMLSQVIQTKDPRGTSNTDWNTPLDCCLLGTTLCPRLHVRAPVIMSNRTPERSVENLG